MLLMPTQGKFVHNKPAGFRVWDSERNEYPPQGPDGVEFVMLSDGSIGRIDWKAFDYANLQICEDHIEIELYTGVWDSEGRPIYEGDVVDVVFFRGVGTPFSASSVCGDLVEEQFQGEVVWMEGPDYLGWVIQADDNIKHWSDTYMPFELTDHFQSGDAITIKATKHDFK